jgi:hypothetical protein
MSLLWALLIFLFTVLDPCYKLCYFQKVGWDNEWIQTSRQLVQEELKHSYWYFLPLPCGDSDSDCEYSDTNVEGSEVTQMTVVSYFDYFFLSFIAFLSFRGRRLRQESQDRPDAMSSIKWMMWPRCHLMRRYQQWTKNSSCTLARSLIKTLQTPFTGG